MNTTTKKTEMVRSDFRRSGVSRQELTCYYIEKILTGPNFPYSRDFVEAVELCLEFYAVVYEDEIVAVEMRAEAEASRLRVLIKDVFTWKANK